MDKIEFRVYCSECGEILEMAEPEIVISTDFTVLVKPCKKCATVLDSTAKDTYMCNECSGVDGYHSTGCTNWLWSPKKGRG